MRFLADRLTPEQIHQRRWLIHAIMSSGLVLIVMAVSSLNVALPTLVRELGATATDLQWIVDSYALVFAGLLLFAGAMGDRFGRRGAFMAGMLVFAVSTVLSSFANDPAQLITYRALMGVGAAFVMPATLSIISNVFHDNKERAKAVAMWAGFAGAGGAIGPIISGVLLNYFWWGSIFLMPIPIIIISMLATFAVVPTSRDPEAERLDIFGSFLSIVGLGTLLYGVIEAPNNGWLSFETAWAILGGAFILLGFAYWERQTSHPMLPMRFFQSKRFSIGSLTLVLTFFALFGMFFVLIQFLQFVLGFSALAAAVRTLPAPVALIITSSQVTRLEERFGTKKIVSLGLLIVAFGFVVLSTLSPESGYAAVFIGLVMLGLGMGLAMPPATEAIIGAVPRRKAGVGSAMNDTTREVGGALGIAVLGSVLASGYKSSIEEKLVGLPEQTLDIAKESIGGALAVASEMGEDGAEIIKGANEAFADGMRLTMWVGAGFLVLSAVLVWRFMPNKERPIDD